MRELVYMPRLFGVLHYPGYFPLSPQAGGWASNVKEDLNRAIKHYYNHFTGDYPVPTKKEEQLLIEFLIYYINAPIWSMNPHDTGQMKKLKRVADEMRTLQQVHDFLEECLDWGLDPL